MNEYFQTGTVPAPSSPGASSVMRQEFANIAAGFDKLPVLSGHQGEIVFVDATGSRLETDGTAVTDFVTLTGAQILTNKTIAWADNTFPGFNDAATKVAGTGADQVLLLTENNKLPALDAGNLINIPGLSLKADANNAVLTGAPVCPTPSVGDSSARIANTQFVTDTVQAVGSFGPSNVAPTMNGAVSSGTSGLGSRDDHVHPVDTSRAPASAATAAGTSYTPGGGIAANTVQGAIAELDSEKASLASPVFSGNPTAPTPSQGDNDTSLATTAFVQTAINQLAPLASPVFTGNPTAPTPLVSDNDTSLATTAFVHTLVAQQPVGMLPSNAAPTMNGVGACGVGVEGSRYDHVHPVDTSRAPASAATAAGTSYTPGGGIAATDVQAALTELDTEKATVVALIAATKGPAFRAVGSVQNPTVNVSTKASLTTEIFDTNNNYDAANSRFTPTVAGYYQVNADGGNRAALDTFGVYVVIVKNNTDVVSQGGSTGNAVTFARGQASGLVYMNGTTDYLEVFLTGNGPSGTVPVICDNFSASMARPA